VTRYTLLKAVVGSSVRQASEALAIVGVVRERRLEECERELRRVVPGVTLFADLMSQTFDAQDFVTFTVYQKA